jgi:hypothetical protein
MRRLREGRWWRPTDWTVALRTEFPDPDFDLLVASAHVWPDGGIAGPSLLQLFALSDLRLRTEVSVPNTDLVSGTSKFDVRRRRSLTLRSWRLPSGRALTVDVGPGSLAAAAAHLSHGDVAWLLIRAKALEPATGAATRLPKEFADYLARTGNDRARQWSCVAGAVAGGCESAGEVYVWFILESLGVPFRTQHHLPVDGTERDHLGTHHIRIDFLLDGDVILEVDSGLHQHLKDVRRDLWNLSAGRRTLRIVGADVIADPVRAQTQLARALRALGVPVRVTPLPAWLTAQ